MEKRAKKKRLFSEKMHLVVFKDNIQYNTIIQYPLFNLVNVLS